MNEFTKALDAVVAAYDKPAYKRIVDIEYIGTLCTTASGTLELGDRFMDEILTKLLKGKDAFKPFAGRVRLIVDEISMSSGIPAETEKEDEAK
nr:MAG TPA: hypothetical protein [Ackermannviridae sp.]